MIKHKQFAKCLAIVFGVYLLFFTAGLAHAATSKNTDVQSVTQSYGSDTALQLGLIVGLSKKDASKVEPLTDKTIKSMYGVVVSPNDSPVTLTPAKTSGHQVFVATYGRHNILVSTQNGPIQPGDYITISALSGIGMKAGTSQSLVIGRAAGNFDGTGNVEGTASLKDTKGKKVNVSLGQVPVNIGIAHNPLEQHLTNYIPGFLQRVGNGVANKTVSPARIYLGLAVLLVGAFIAGSLLFAGVKNGMVSVGRNPLARKLIMRSLLQVVIVSLIIFIISAFAVYLLIKL
jgi:hypothetical protein